MIAALRAAALPRVLRVPGHRIQDLAEHRTHPAQSEQEPEQLPETLHLNSRLGHRASPGLSELFPSNLRTRPKLRQVSRLPIPWCRSDEL